MSLISKYAIAIHGGAGVISRSTDPERIESYKIGLTEALQAGVLVLKSGGTALDATIEAVRSMEDNPLFNAGVGAVYNADGKHELDASLMDGNNLKCGAVTGVKTTKNPILLAKKVMEESEHILLCGDGADKFASLHGLEQVENYYFDTEYRYNAWLKAKSEGKIILDHTADSNVSLGTVGAVALDIKGNLATSTSTGGMTNKKFMRIGDTPIIGAGTYANNETCAVSCTGIGELFMTGCTAYDIHAKMTYLGLGLEDAADYTIGELPDGAGGFIAIDNNGTIVMPYNSLGMFRGKADSSGLIEVAIWE